MTKPKLLIHSNAPWAPTGYGQQVALFAPLLNQHYDVAISAFYGLEGAPIVWDGIPVFAGLGGEWGNDTLVQHAGRFFDGDAKGGLVLTLCDVWPLDPAIGEQVNLACWVPVDHQPAPPKVLEFLTRSGAVPIAMTRFGQRQLMLLDPLYTPHGVDTRIYHPAPQRPARRGLLPDDAFLVSIIGANKGHPSRKALPQALEGFARLARRHDNAYLYLHTVLSPAHGRGEDLAALITALGIPERRIRKADQYALMHAPYSPKQMASLYAATDVLLNPSMGEGFGVPILEAAACGVPSIVTDWTAMPEVQGGAGWQVRHHPYWSALNAWEATPDIDAIDEALEACHQLTVAGRAELATRGRRHAEGYDARRVLSEDFLPALRTAAQRFALREPVRLPAREAVPA
jgi:glycosyltransferase involved in cell wall biosynthesis